MQCQRVPLCHASAIHSWSTPFLRSVLQPCFRWPSFRENPRLLVLLVPISSVIFGRSSASCLGLWSAFLVVSIPKQKVRWSSTTMRWRWPAPLNPSSSSWHLLWVKYTHNSFPVAYQSLSIFAFLYLELSSVPCLPDSACGFWLLLPPQINELVYRFFAVASLLLLLTSPSVLSSQTFIHFLYLLSLWGSRILR